MTDPTGLGFQKNTRMLNPTPKNVGGSPKTALILTLSCKTVKGEEAYTGGQKLQTYIEKEVMEKWKEGMEILGKKRRRRH